MRPAGDFDAPADAGCASLALGRLTGLPRALLADRLSSNVNAPVVSAYPGEVYDTIRQTLFELP